MSQALPHLHCNRIALQVQMLQILQIFANVLFEIGYFLNFIVTKIQIKQTLQFNVFQFCNLVMGKAQINQQWQFPHWVDLLNVVEIQIQNLKTLEVVQQRDAVQLALAQVQNLHAIKRDFLFNDFEHARGCVSFPKNMPPLLLFSCCVAVHPLQSFPQPDIPWNLFFLQLGLLPWVDPNFAFRIQTFIIKELIIELQGSKIDDRLADGAVRKLSLGNQIVYTKEAEVMVQLTERDRLSRQ